MAFTYRGQQMRKWVPLTMLALGVAFVALLVVIIARHKPVPQEYYAERQLPGPNGTVVVREPDHSWLYYYLLMQMNRPVQPTYTTRPYVPPPRPTHVPPATTSYSTPAPNRSSGGFSGGASSQPSNRSSGGFSSSPSRSYSSPSSSSSRSTGGFSSSPSKSYSSPSGSSNRSSGGFSSSRPSSSSSSRSSGGFSKPKGGGQ